MSPIARLAFALALTVIAPATLLARPTSARACGTYVDPEEARVRSATFARLHEQRPGAQISVQSVIVEDKQATAIVHFLGQKGAPSTAVVVWLERRANGKWAVTGQSYALQPETANAMFAAE